VVGKNIDHWYDALRYLLMMLTGRTRQSDENPVQNDPRRRAPMSTGPTAVVNQVTMQQNVQKLRRMGF
jgi:hypothetical protein